MSRHVRHACTLHLPGPGNPHHSCPHPAPDAVASQTLPFVFHLLIETAAAASFIFRPEQQLPDCSAAAKLILRQYGGLLLSTNLVCLVAIFHQQPSSCGTGATRLLAAALGSYHAWPIHRALARLLYKVQVDGEGEGAALGGPVVHLVLHSLCLAAFLALAVFEDDT